MGLGSSLESMSHAASRSGEPLRRAIRGALSPQVKEKAERTGIRIRAAQASGEEGATKAASIIAAMMK